MSSSSSAWAKKLEAKLDGLADGASKESIQTLANWIAFNRRHAPAIAAVLTGRLVVDKAGGGGGSTSSSKQQRQRTYWQVLHEVLVTDHPGGTSGAGAATTTTAANKWEKLAELRAALGEALVPAMEAMGGDGLPPSDQMDPFLKEWADLNVFGGPSLLAQIRRLYLGGRGQQAGAGAAEGTSAAAAPPAQDAPAKEDGAKLPPAQAADSEPKSAPDARGVVTGGTTSSKPSARTETAAADGPTEKRASFSHLDQEVEYDFESKVRSISVTG